jgi:hypothetical protein
VLNLVKKEDFSYRQIGAIKVSDTQQWIMKLQNDGKGYSTIISVRGVVKPAFQMAYNEDIIRRNPFDFKLVDVVSNDSQKRIAMTAEQQELWMNFIRKDKTYTKYYDEFVVLLETGMRVTLTLKKPICRKRSENQVKKCTDLLHHLLHHLPMNLRRIIKNCVGLGQNTKWKKMPRSPKYQDIKAYERIFSR